MTKSVNRSPAVLPNMLEGALRQLRAGLYELSETRFPGLRTRHYRLLTFVPEHGIRPARMVELSGLTKQALGQALDPLQQGGYVDVVPDPTDRRARVVLLTPRGRDVITAVLDMQESYERRWAEQVGQDRWRVAREVLLDLFTG